MVSAPATASPWFPPAQTRPDLRVCGGDVGCRAGLPLFPPPPPGFWFFQDPGWERYGELCSPSSALMSQGGWVTASLSLSLMNAPVHGPLSRTCALTPPVSMWSPCPAEAPPPPEFGFAHGGLGWWCVTRSAWAPGFLLWPESSREELSVRAKTPSPVSHCPLSCASPGRPHDPHGPPC